ncbi:MAG: hypothetical protein KA052_03110 [Candidatus Pacebacteria bacterium]|nr:hypothetical protein [Candidatus Paceibacterota bacterium]
MNNAVFHKGNRPTLEYMVKKITYKNLLGEEEVMYVKFPAIGFLNQDLVDHLASAKVLQAMPESKVDLQPSTNEEYLAAEDEQRVSLFLACK